MMGTAAIAVLLGLMQMATADTPPCAMKGTCGKPTTTFPKLDKAICERMFPTLDSFTCDVFDTTHKVCASLDASGWKQRSFPNKCTLIRFVCSGLMAGGKPSAKYLYDGYCTMRGASSCGIWPTIAVKGAPQVCAKLGNAAPSKANLQIFATESRMRTVMCGIPDLQKQPMSVCQKAGVVFKPRPPMPKAEKACMAMAMKCDYKLRGAAVCGSNGVTYVDACNLNYDNCMTSTTAGPGKPGYWVSVKSGGACPIKCDTKNPCPKGMKCIGTCIPDGLDKCSTMKCAAGTECKVQISKYRTGSGYPVYWKCLPKPATPAKCNVAAMTSCLRVTLTSWGRPKNYSPCGVLVETAACAVGTNCMTAAKRACTVGVLINQYNGGSGKPVLPANCAAPSCKNAIDKKCQANAYNKCAVATYNIANLCDSYTAQAKCISKYNCDEDLEAICYMAKWDGCKGQPLIDVCAKSKTPIKELSNEYLQIYSYARLHRNGSQSQSRGSPGLVAGVACVAFAAVALAAFVIRRRRQSTMEAEEELTSADYQAVEEEI